jgi:hypothetical protein
MSDEFTTLYESMKCLDSLLVDISQTPFPALKIFEDAAYHRKEFALRTKRLGTYTP